MLEPAATVHCRKKDVLVVESVSQGAKKQYREISGRDIIIATEGTLADDRCDLAPPRCHIPSTDTSDRKVLGVLSSSAEQNGLLLTTHWMRDYDCWKIGCAPPLIFDLLLLFSE